MLCDWVPICLQSVEIDGAFKGLRLKRRCRLTRQRKKKGYGRDVGMFGVLPSKTDGTVLRRENGTCWSRIWRARWAVGGRETRLGEKNRRGRERQRAAGTRGEKRGAVKRGCASQIFQLFFVDFPGCCAVTFVCVYVCVVCVQNSQTVLRRPDRIQCGGHRGVAAKTGQVQTY